MDNVINLFAAKEAAEPASGDPALDFIRNHLMPWAAKHGVDTSSQKFKLNGATIMTCVQGMLLDDI